MNEMRRGVNVLMYRILNALHIITPDILLSAPETGLPAIASELFSKIINQPYNTSTP
jgi:hypothetical protein